MVTVAEAAAAWRGVTDFMSPKHLLSGVGLLRGWHKQKNMRNRKRRLGRIVVFGAAFGISAAATIFAGGSAPAAVAAAVVAGVSACIVVALVGWWGRLPDYRAEVEAVLKDIDDQIEKLAWAQIRLPPASAGKSSLLQTCDAARAVAGRLHQGNASLAPARRADRKLRTCVRIACGYQELLCGGLLAGTEERRTLLIKSIECEALPKITDQLLNFARDLDEADILDLEVELKVLDRMG
jgi:hypothetical protein